MLLPVPPPPCLKPLPTPGMSFAYNIPCLLPSEEGAPLHLSPPSSRHLGPWKPAGTHRAFISLSGRNGWETN